MENEDLEVFYREVGLLLDAALGWDTNNVFLASLFTVILAVCKATDAGPQEFEKFLVFSKEYLERKEALEKFQSTVVH